MDAFLVILADMLFSLINLFPNFPEDFRNKLQNPTFLYAVFFF